MSNNLKNLEKQLRSYAKRVKGVSYTSGLLIAFLLTGMISLSATTQTDKKISQVKTEIGNTTTEVKQLFLKAKKENEKLLKDTNLELIKLMEQGDQVVKSPWSSWQFGVNTFIGSNKGRYSGKGDKDEKYPYEGIFKQDPWYVSNININRDSKIYEEKTIKNKYRIAESRELVYNVENDTYEKPDGTFVANASEITTLGDTVVPSATTTTRNEVGKKVGYGLIEARKIEQEGPISIELSANVKPKSINKNKPTSLPEAPTVSLPGFIPRTAKIPDLPSNPVIPNIAEPQFNVTVVSNGNGESNVIDGSGNNSTIEMVAITSGDFKVKRDTGDNWKYEYKNYSGVNAFPKYVTSNATGGNPPITVAPNGTWSNLEKTGGTNSGQKGFQSVVGSQSNGSAFLSNGNFLYTREFQNGTSNLGEFVHLDVHGAALITTQRPQYEVATAGLEEAKKTEILGAYDDAMAIKGTDTQGKENGVTTGSFLATNSHTWLNSGKIVIEGGNTSLTNTYTHVGNIYWKQAAINTGEVIFQPYKAKEGGNVGKEYNKFTAGFVVSNDVSYKSHNVMYNSGSMKNYTLSGVGYVYDGSSTKPLTVVNRGITQMYGEGSAGIYIKRQSNLDTQFVTKDFILDTTDTTNNTVLAGEYKPLEIFGDKSIGLYQFADSGTVEGHLAINIGAKGKGNQKFTTATVSGMTAGEELTDYDINPSSPDENIEGSFGILSNAAINLSSHKIKIFDKTKGNVGVHPLQNKLLSLGGGSVEILAGETGTNNIGLLTDGKGAIKSTGSLIMNGGVANNGIVSKGNAALPTEATEDVVVKDLQMKDTKDSFGIYASSGAKVKVTDGVTAKNVTVSEDASTTNRKNTGIVFAQDANTVVTISKTELPNTSNIEVTGTKLADTNGYTGFGLFANNGAKIEAKYNNIKIKNGSAAVISTGNNSNVDLSNSKIEYDGEGFALYGSNNGRITLDHSELTLRGKAIGYENDLTHPSVFWGTDSKINIYSNDVVLFNLKNVPTLQLSTLYNNVLNAGGTHPTINTVDPETGINYNKYKMAGVDGLGTFNIDQTLDKKVSVETGRDQNIDAYVRSLIIQRAKLHVLSENNVIAHLNSTELNSLGLTQIVGLDMSSSKNATNSNETQINLEANTKVSADRTDSGNGAVGIYINYGEVNTDAAAKVEVERHTENAANDEAVGVYAINGSKITNGGTVSVGGNKSIGLLGISSRVDKGEIIGNEYNQAAGTYGSISINNNGTVTLDGEKAVGIYLENNDTNNVQNTSLTARNNGIIEVSGANATGIAGKEIGSIENDTNGIIKAEKGVGIYAESSSASTITNKGTIEAGTDNLGDGVGIFAKSQGVKVKNEKIITVGKNSYGILGKDVEIGGTSVITVGESGTGIYSDTGVANPAGNIVINNGAKFNIGNNNAVGVFTADTVAGTIIKDNGGEFNVGDKSFGYALIGTGSTLTTSATGKALLENDGIYIYSRQNTLNVNTNITATGNNNYGIYNVGGTATVNNTISMENGNGNVGLYSNGGILTHSGNIMIGGSTVASDGSLLNGIGVAADGGANVTLNNGDITLKGDNSIGVYASGNGTTLTNNKNIIFDPTSPVSRMTGIYASSGAKVINNGNISTANGNTNVKGIVGIGIKDSTLENHGNITINAGESYGLFIQNSLIKNYGNITVNGKDSKGISYDVKSIGEDGTTKLIAGNEINGAGGSVTVNGEISGKNVYSKGYDASNEVPGGAVSLKPDASGKVIVERNGKTIDPYEIPSTDINTVTLGFDNVGIYVDTLGKTNPINGVGYSSSNSSTDLIIGAEAADVTSEKDIRIGSNIIKKFIDAMGNVSGKPNIYSGALNWITTYDDATNSVVMSKRDYKEQFGLKSANDSNFLDGLDQRYGVDTKIGDRGYREKLIFNKLNRIGKNEQMLMLQSFDEMMGHQYANTQMRIKNTGDQLNKEFKYLMTDWYNPSKQNNKVKVFGMKSDFNTDTAGIKDFESNSYGVAYVHEDETIKLGQSSGWYAGLIHNRFRFKDIGKSVEDQNMLKLGVFKTRAYDNNGSLKWKVSLDGFVGMNDMDRRYLVVDRGMDKNVDEIFGAKSRYYTYGIGLRNEVSKDYRLSEHVSLVPYGSLNVEYGRFTTIKEKKGEMRLEVKGNHYISVKPEIGAELKFNKKINSEFKLTLSAGLAYELELGKVYKGNNKARVNYTNADWYNLANEKENRTGNLKGDLKFGLEKNRFGLTLNVGYDTKGNNLRGGIGVRGIF